MLRVLAALAAFVLLVAACGGSDDDETATAGDSGSDDSSDDGGGDDAPADDDDGDATEPEDDADDEPVDDDFDPSGSGDFCGLYIQNQDLLTQFDFFDPLQVQQWIDTSIGLLDQAIATAPPEILADLQTVRADLDTVVEVLEENDYDFVAAAETMDTLDTPDADAASDRIDAYVESVCGVDPDQATEDLTDNMIEENLDSLLENDAFLAMIVEGMTEDGDLTEEQATCFLQNFDTELFAGFATDAGADALSDPAVLQDLLGVFETCGIPLG